MSTAKDHTHRQLNNACKRRGLLFPKLYTTTGTAKKESAKVHRKLGRKTDSTVLGLEEWPEE